MLGYEKPYSDEASIFFESIRQIKPLTLTRFKDAVAVYFYTAAALCLFRGQEYEDAEKERQCVFVVDNGVVRFLVLYTWIKIPQKTDAE